MPQDAFSLLHTANELNATLKNARVDKINQPDSDCIILNVRAENQNLKLLVSANAQYARIVLTKSEKTNPMTAPGFCMLLRKHLSHAVIKNIELIGFERIVKIDFENKNEMFENTEKSLYAEIMGKYSNVILVENNMILGAMKQSSLDSGNLRPIVGGLKYSLPLTQDKVEISNVHNSSQRLETFSNGNLAEFIFNNFKGIAKSTAEEIVESYKVKNNIENDFVIIDRIKDFINYFNDYYVTPNLNPNIVYTDKLLDFFICNYKSIYGQKTFYNSINEAIDEFYSQKENQKVFDNKRSKLNQIVHTYEKKQDKKLQIVLEKELSTSDMDKYKLYGELILSNLYQLKQPTEKIELIDYSKEDFPKIEIKLDKEISPKQNADKFFRKYSKAKKTLVAIAPQKIELNEILSYLSSVLDEITDAETLDDLNDIEQELVTFGIIKANAPIKNKKEQPSKPRIFNFEGFNIFVGRNNLQNDRLTLSADRNDMFVHAKGYHSAHVIIVADNKQIPDSVIERAAEICAFYSKAKDGTKVPIDYTFKKFVKKTNGLRTGTVIYTNQKTILVTPRNPFVNN